MCVCIQSTCTVRRIIHIHCMYMYLDCPPILVSISSPIEQPLYGQVHLSLAIIHLSPGHRADSCGYLIVTQLKVLRDVVDDLCSVVSSSLTPAAREEDTQYNDGIEIPFNKINLLKMSTHT